MVKKDATPIPTLPVPVTTILIGGKFIFIAWVYSSFNVFRFEGEGSVNKLFFNP